MLKIYTISGTTDTTYMRHVAANSRKEALQIDKELQKRDNLQTLWTGEHDYKVKRDKRRTEGKEPLERMKQVYVATQAILSTFIPQEFRHLDTLNMSMLKVQQR